MQRTCGGCVEGAQRAVVGTCSQIKNIIGCMEGMWRACRGCVEGCGGDM